MELVGSSLPMGGLFALLPALDPDSTRVQEDHGGRREEVITFCC